MQNCWSPNPTIWGQWSAQWHQYKNALKQIKESDFGDENTRLDGPLVWHSSVFLTLLHSHCNATTLSTKCVADRKQTTDEQEQHLWRETKYITEATIRKIRTLWESLCVTKFKHMMKDQLVTNHCIQTKKKSFFYDKQPIEINLSLKYFSEQ